MQYEPIPINNAVCFRLPGYELHESGQITAQSGDTTTVQLHGSDELVTIPTDTLRFVRPNSYLRITPDTLAQLTAITGDSGFWYGYLDPRWRGHKHQPVRHIFTRGRWVMSYDESDLHWPVDNLLLDSLSVLYHLLEAINPEANLNYMFAGTGIWFILLRQTANHFAISAEHLCAATWEQSSQYLVDGIAASLQSPQRRGIMDKPASSLRTQIVYHLWRRQYGIVSGHRHHYAPQNLIVYLCDADGNLPDPALNADRHLLFKADDNNKPRSKVKDTPIAWWCASDIIPASEAKLHQQELPL